MTWNNPAVSLTCGNELRVFSLSINPDQALTDLYLCPLSLSQRPRGDTSTLRRSEHEEMNGVKVEAELRGEDCQQLPAEGQFL